MPRLCANITLLFTEVELPERFAAAARAGFEAVEIQFPYAYDQERLARRARAAGVEVVLINMPAGDWDAGDRGLGCLPSRQAEFRAGVPRAISYARALGCRKVNCLAGTAPADGAEAALRRTFVSNLRFAAAELALAGMDLLIEPQNTQTFPGIYLNGSAQAVSVIKEAGAPNLRLQYDLFHMQIMEGDLARTLEDRLACIGHIQVADVPGRHEPGSGGIDYPCLFDLIDRLGYPGWVGAEYLPAGRTEDGLAWARPYLRAK